MNENDAMAAVKGLMNKAIWISSLCKLALTTTVVWAIIKFTNHYTA